MLFPPCFVDSTRIQCVVGEKADLRPAARIMMTLKGKKTFRDLKILKYLTKPKPINTCKYYKFQTTQVNLSVSFSVPQNLRVLHFVYFLSVRFL